MHIDEDLGHGHGHGHGHSHANDHDEASFDAEAEALIWAIDNVELLTVGVDVGSATSHVMFAKVLLRRQAQALSSRFKVVKREILYYSPVFVTPYLSGTRIDVNALRVFLDESYRAAGLLPEAVDAGAVILTGVALERENSRTIAELFAEQGGKFVCAAAGHNLEARLAANGSGAVAMSAKLGQEILVIDIGGGTTKFALARGGELIATLVVPGGGRLLAWDTEHRLERIEESLRPLAESLGIELTLGERVTPEHVTALTQAMAARIADAARGIAKPAEVLSGALPSDASPQRLLISGGVAEYLRHPDGTDLGHRDLGQSLAHALRTELDALDIPIEVAVDPIHATVIGASQFSVQLSGNTVHVSDERLLPLHNIPVVTVRHPGPSVDATALRDQIDTSLAQLDLLESTTPVAIALDWRGEPYYANLRGIADAVHAAHRDSPRRDQILVLCLNIDVAASVGAILDEERKLETGAVVIDGVELADLDFLDVGKRIRPANTIPIVIKSLLFPEPPSHTLVD